MKIAVIGADGQLGTDIRKTLEDNDHEVKGLTISDIDITDSEAVTKLMAKIRPQMVINTAAFHDVPKCESEPVKSYMVNAEGARNLAVACNSVDATLMQISTDYVFDGKKQVPYIETDRTVPLNVYANTKLSGEHYVEAIAKKYYILRVSGIYGKTPCIGKGGKNFVELMLWLSQNKPEVRVVDDEFLTPTSTVEVSRQIKKMMDVLPEFGLYHATAEGSCSWYEFAKEIFDITKPDIKFNKALPGEFKVDVNRPTYSVLENKHLNDLGINVFRNWKDGLREYLSGN